MDVLSETEIALAVFDRTTDATTAASTITLRLAEAARAVELSWAEAVAVVQAVCAQLEPGRTPPAVGDLRLCAAGGVTFPPGGIIDEDVAIQLTARLLARLAGDGPYPLEVCEALERAQVAPMTFGSAAGFGASLTCVPRGRGAALLAGYVRDVSTRGVLIWSAAPQPRSSFRFPRLRAGRKN